MQNYFNISIPLNFQNEKNQLSMYDVPPGVSVPYQSGTWIGSTKQGGSCNFRTVTITPHCNGTHTECIGHIVNNEIFLPDILQIPIFTSLLITVPFRVYENRYQDSYLPKLENGDKIITQNDLENTIKPKLKAIQLHNIEGIILRTYPNPETKKNQNYNAEPAPFFTNDAIKYLTELGFKHLIVDLPSLDKAYDEGLLSNHHIFWKQPIKKYDLDAEANIHKTITELVYIPNEIADGIYETFLGFPTWKEEAVPSSVWIKPLLLSENKLRY